ncbi:unnamed protein product, partial [Urochloa humidicola]
PPPPPLPPLHTAAATAKPSSLLPPLPHPPHRSSGQVQAARVGPRPPASVRWRGPHTDMPWQRADPYRRPTLEVTVAYVAAAGKEEETMESAAAAATEADWGAAAEEAGRGYILGSASDAVNWRSAMMTCAVTLPPSSAISFRRCFAEISKTGGLPRDASHVDLLSGHGAVEDAVEIIPKLETASKIDSLARKGIAKVFPIQEGHGHKGAREITHLDSWPRAHYHKPANCIDGMIV